MVSVVILTLNEEKDIKECINSLEWAEETWVIDSGSRDQTRRIAQECGANVIVNSFQSFGKQRNFALDAINFKSEWVLFLDADERSTLEFAHAVKAAISSADVSMCGFYCCWKMILDGKWLRRCDNFPKWQFRLLRRGMARFTDFGHGQKEWDLKGSVGYIKEPYLHYAFSKGWFHWVERHNRYSSQEAYSRAKNRPPFRHIFLKNQSFRNAALRSFLIRVPGWPLLRFMQAYFLNLGFLDGRPGFIYCVNMAYYEFLIMIKMQEARKVKQQELL